MALIVGTAGSGNQAPRAIYVGTAASGNQAVLAGYVGTAGSGNQLFFSALSASASDASATRATAGAETTNASTCVTSGGVGPFSFAWSISSDGNGAVTINSATSQSTTFTGNVSGATATRVLIATCSVTDSSTGATAQASCRVTLAYTGTGG